MKTYVVGGAVRDEMLGLPVKDRDHVVVGATPEEMIRLGFKPVGKDFPVFLHPQTHEEYALARTERKTAPGYHGFTFHAAPDVTLEQDLQRRDLTINAMARDAEGRLIDPYCGANDLGAGVLRHVSEAFAEDPVRILRVARFAARFGFDIAPETMDLMKQMVRAGEADALIAERVWQELARGLMENAPSVMLGVLHDCGALERVMPQVEMLYKSGQQEDAFAALNAAAGQSGPLEVRFAALLKMLEPEAIETLCAKLRVPAACRDLAMLTARHGNALADGTEMEAGELLAVFDAVDAWRRPERFAALLQAALAGVSEGERTRQHLSRTHEAALAVDAGEIARLQKSPADIKAAIAQARLDRMRAAT